MASTFFSLLVIALFVSVQGTLAHSPLDSVKNLNETLKGEKGEGLGQLKKYLEKIGYIDPTSTTTTNSAHDDEDIFDDALEQALIKYQGFYKLKATGALDSETVASMRKPRCGVADFHELSHNSSSFNDMKYAFLGPKWAPNKRNLTVSFPDGTRVDAYYPVNQALHKWANVSDFIFTWVNDVKASDVKMSFQRGDHGDGGPFDGPGGVLAHTSNQADPTSFYIHFDADEDWGTKNNTEEGKIDLHSSALHELGHVLGLGHSQDPNAVMYPSISDGVRTDLNSDDKDGIKALYN